ncbi:hypothetical protein [Streptomyces misionensis]
MEEWRLFRRQVGLPYALFTALMAMLIVASGAGMVGGIAWMWWAALHS